MEDNPDLTREEAEEIYKKNKELNSGSRISINVGGEQNTNNQTSAGMGGMADATNQLDNIEPIKEIEFPDLRQDYDFTCGASSLQGVLQLYGDDAVESELVKELNTEKDWGTEHTDIIKVAIAHGFKAESKSMTIEEVQSYIDEDYPVILDIQAWTEQKNVDYSTDKEDGHYVVAIGYDENGFVVEDPSSIGRAYLSFADLESRWHDVDKQGNELKNLGIVIKGEIKYSRNKYVELG
jgi:predicted double-glycine peptidase